MNKYIKLIKIKEILIFIILICFQYPFLNKRIGFISVLKSGHYIGLIINNYILITIYRKMKIINHISPLLILRKDRNTIEKEITLSLIALTGMMVSILYILLICFYGILPINSVLILITLLYFIEVMIIAFQFNKQANILYIMVPVIINLVFHYIIFQ